VDTPFEGGKPMMRKRAFTLIELLVVIAIIALLMAILVPVLRGVRNQAKAVACQSNLRQWGVVFSMYKQDNDGKFPHWYSPSWVSVRVEDAWPYTLRPYYSDSNDLLLCPMATGRKVPDPLWPYDGQPGGTWRAWKWKIHTRVPELVFCGSYGWSTDAHKETWPILRGLDPSHLQEVYQPPLANVPALLDCVWLSAWPSRWDDPPEYEDELFHGSGFGGVEYFCINRHNGHVNGLFLDWSVRKVGLKELWTLQWGPFFDTANESTKAGGVQPEDWPPWMRRFKDY
jgi:prepilin-type N-terminal cleavage/methylation domain-containing protein/prepilin-type processing-associated H-X9-DG protein